MLNKKYTFNIVRIEDSEWRWCYSAKELQQLINDVCCQQRLLRLMAELHGYVHLEVRGNNYLDFSYMGGNILLVFDKAVLELDICVEGLMRYRICKPWNIQIRPVNDYIPEDYITNPIYFCDLNEDFEEEYTNIFVSHSKVDATDTCGFYAVGFDEQKESAAARGNDLPNAIRFVLDNGTELCLRADGMENYTVELQKIS